MLNIDASEILKNLYWDTLEIDRILIKVKINFAWIPIKKKVLPKIKISKIKWTKDQKSEIKDQKSKEKQSKKIKKSKDQRIKNQK